jgi:hypothetical protein
MGSFLGREYLAKAIPSAALVERQNRILEECLAFLAGILERLHPGQRDQLEQD